MTQLGKNDTKRSRSGTKTSFGAGSRLVDCLQTGGTGMPLKSITESLERELNQDFFSSNKVIIPKKKIKKRSFNNYSPTKVKAKNFLSNIS